MKKISKFLTWLLIVSIIFNILPQNIVVHAATGNPKVRVVVKNDNYKTVDGAKWEGTLIDRWVEITDTSTSMSVVAEAIKASGYTQTGAESGYITEINGISAYDAGSSSGWMGTLNDWFTDKGLSEYKAANNTLQDGDEICFAYTLNWGEDLGSLWSSSDTSLKNIKFSDGVLNTAFDSKNKEYTLTVSDDVNSISVTPTAFNKNFQVRVYKDEYTPNSAETDIKRSKDISIQDGTKLYIGVGNTNWPSMNGGQTESIYVINVKKTGEEQAEKPKFEKFEFSAFALNNWVANTTFSPDVYKYDVNIKAYSTSTLSVSSTTKYDSEKYSAKAKYTDINGDEREIDILSGKMASLTNMPFGTTILTVTLTDLSNSANYTDYIFNVTRPYDKTSQIKASTGMVIVPEGRELLSTNYMGKSEGTMFKLDGDGSITTSGITSDYYDYKAFLLEKPEKFAIKLTGKTNYVHIRISDDGENYSEVTSGGISPMYSFENDKEKTFTVQTISDEEYFQNGFKNVDSLGSLYTLKVVLAEIDTESAKITTAVTESGEWYPEFSKNVFAYNILIDNDSDIPELKFDAANGAVVSLGANELEKQSDGLYHIQLKTSAQSISVKSSDDVINSYSFKVTKRSKYDVPDKVVDYLCVNSQYTNSTSFGASPEATLAGNLRSLGNFGGYITYYYENAIKNDPANMYGVDFYVYGNSFAVGGSAAETGQVWVSEDGNDWYALAGSEHYEDSTIKNYEITYTKTESGKTAWTDNLGGSNDGTTKSGAWPLAGTYYMNSLLKNDTITLRGILIPGIDGSLYGDGTTASYVGATHFGYVDYAANGTIGADVNPYAEKEGSNGFDLSWAVDAAGNPVNLENGIHYIKVVTASNIWAGSFNDKSTEVSYVVRTTAKGENVGVTENPAAIILKDDNGKTTRVELVDGKNQYEVKLNDMPNVNISLEGISEADNVFVNNQRISGNDEAEINVSEDGKQVRVIVQNGDKEPVIYMLTLTNETIEKTENIFNETTEALLSGDTPVVGTLNGEWKVIGLQRGGAFEDKLAAGYFENVYRYVTENGNAKLHNTKSSDNSRVILALTSLGYDVTDINGYNLLEPLGDYDYVIKQGINGAIWALTALNSAEYEVNTVEKSEDTQNIREKLINYILQQQIEDGGFSLDGQTSDADITAMTVQALSKYYGSDENIKAAVDKAVELLSEMQNADGSFGSSGTSNCESTAQVVVALSTLGINPRTDSRFIKSGTSVLSALDNFYISEGEFCHTKSGEYDVMATEQAYLGLVAYRRLVSDKNDIYDMSDVEKLKNPEIEEDEEQNNNKPDDDKKDETVINDNKDNNSLINDTNKDLSENNQDEALPKTGDYTNILMYVLLMTGSGAGVYVIYRIKRRKRA